MNSNVHVIYGSGGEDHESHVNIKRDEKLSSFMGLFFFLEITPMNTHTKLYRYEHLKRLSRDISKLTSRHKHLVIDGHVAYH
jgi:hypothetical protein